MAGKIKRFLLCLAAVSLLSVNGNIYADDENFSVKTGVPEEVPSEEESESKRSETVEEPEIDMAVMEKYFTYAGSAEGLDFYLRSSEPDEKQIWTSYGFPEGRPARRAKLDPDQETAKKAAEEEIASIKNMGAAAALYTESGKPAAVFEEISSTSESKRYISEKGRFIAEFSNGNVSRAYRIVSSLDSKNVFFTDGTETLAVMSDDNKKTDVVYTYASTGDGYRLYESETAGTAAWISEDGKRFLGVYRCCSENEKFRLLIDDRYATLGIENKETGYIWWSSPLGASQDEYATDLLVDDLRSSSTLKYGVPSKRSNNNILRSGHSSDCSITVKDISGGVNVTYDYKKAGFSYPVEYTLEEDHLRASLKISEITESNDSNIATEITLLGNFGAADTSEEGYYLIPDGCGAIMRFNGKGSRSTENYLQRVYGRDVTAVPLSRGPVTEQIYMPVYGIVKQDNALLAIADKGDSNALISAKPALRSNTGYNLCSFVFTLRGTDTYYMSGRSNQEFTVFERGGINCDDIEVRYYPISGKGADCVDIAARYREYLMDEKGVKQKSEPDYAPLFIDLYGGVQKKKSVLGIPVTMKTAVTEYDEAEDILSDLRDGGVDDIVASYVNWTNDGINNKIDTSAKPSRTLGGKKEFNSLKDYAEENNVRFYPVSDNSSFYSGNGYYSFNGTSVRISGVYSKSVSYDMAYGVTDSFSKDKLLLTPHYFEKVLGKVADSYDSAGLEGICISNLTTSLYGDYGRKRISRYDAMNELTESYAELNDSLGGGILADNANAYAFPYVSAVKKVPLSSSRFDVFDEDIPFYQMVMHGIVPYSSPAVNASADPETLLLMSAATGSCLSFDMLSAETSLLKDTEFDIYYYADQANWKDTAAAEYSLLEPLLSDISTSTITDYENDKAGNRITVTYSNGTVVRVDFKDKNIWYNEKLISLGKEAEEGEIRY